jgi:hypothetical protein
MSGYISPAEARELILAVDHEEELPKKKMEILEEFLVCYGKNISAEGRRIIREKLNQLSSL